MPGCCLERRGDFDDPQFYNKPLTVKVTHLLQADSDILEYVCVENEKDRVHMNCTSLDLLSQVGVVTTGAIQECVTLLRLPLARRTMERGGNG